MPELIEAVLERSGYLEALEAERTIEAQGRHREPAGARRRRPEYLAASGSEPTLSGFLQEISLYSDQDAIRGEQSLVTLMTIHNAKGLEFRAVFMIGMEEGIFPHVRSIEEQGIEEERRLAYVGMTRAQERLRSRTRRRASSAAAARTTCRRASSTSCPEDGRRARAAAAGVVVELRRARQVTPREDVPTLSTGDSVRHGTLGEGVVLGIEPGGVVTVRFADDGSRAAADARVRAVGEDRRASRSAPCADRAGAARTRPARSATTSAREPDRGGTRALARRTSSSSGCTPPSTAARSSAARAPSRSR